MTEKFNKLYEQYIDNNKNILDVIDIDTDSSNIDIPLWMVIDNNNPKITVYKNKKRRGEKFSLSIENTPKTTGDVFVSDKKLEKIKKFIKNNINILKDYWNFKIYSDEFYDKLIPVTEDILTEMSNIPPRKTGLKKPAWISPTTTHGPRIKIYRTRPSEYDESFTVTIEDEPQIIGKVFVTNKELKNIKSFVKLNKDLFLMFWDSKIGTKELLKNLKKI